MATIPCPHPAALSESQDWYRQTQSARSRQASGYDTKKKLRNRLVKRSYIDRIRAERHRKLYDKTISLLLTEHEVGTPAVSAPSIDVQRHFYALADEWTRAVGNSSSLTAMSRHPKYREIVDLGWPVVPYLLRDLQRGRGFWFPALDEITGIRPFDLRDAGNSKRMIQAWIQWGKIKKLI